MAGVSGTCSSKHSISSLTRCCSRPPRMHGWRSTECWNMLKDFSFGLNYGTETYCPRDVKNGVYEHVEVYFRSPPQMLQVTYQDSREHYVLTFFDMKDYRMIARVLHQRFLKEFDPLTFRALAYEWVGVPQE